MVAEDEENLEFEVLKNLKKYKSSDLKRLLKKFNIDLDYKNRDQLIEKLIKNNFETAKLLSDSIEKVKGVSINRIFDEVYSVDAGFFNKIEGCKKRPEIVTIALIEDRQDILEWISTVLQILRKRDIEPEIFEGKLIKGILEDEKKLEQKINSLFKKINEDRYKKIELDGIEIRGKEVVLKILTEIGKRYVNQLKIRGGPHHDWPVAKKVIDIDFYNNEIRTSYDQSDKDPFLGSILKIFIGVHPEREKVTYNSSIVEPKVAETISNKIANEQAKVESYSGGFIQQKLTELFEQLKNKKVKSYSFKSPKVPGEPGYVNIENAVDADEWLKKVDPENEYAETSDEMTYEIYLSGKDGTDRSFRVMPTKIRFIGDFIDSEKKVIDRIFRR